VYLNASANVTVGYVFNGITSRDDLKWVPKHLALFDQTVTGVMRGVGSDMAGGYDKVRKLLLCSYPFWFACFLKCLFSSCRSDMAGGYDKV
jgi:hypothetical protein